MREILLTSSVLILAVLLLRRAFRDRISRRAQYVLWALVLVRLLVPVSLPGADISVLSAAEPVGRTVTERLEQREIYRVPLAPSPMGTAPQVTSPAPQIEGGGSPSGEAAAPSGGEEAFSYPVIRERVVTAADLLTVLWLIGIAAMAVWFLVTNLRFWQKLRRTRAPYAAENCRYPVYLVEAGLPSPCLFGLFRPAIYLTPAVVTSPERLRHVLAHETAHARHLDPLWSLLRSVCLTVYWFDPLVWIAAAVSKADGELACDEAAIQALGEGERIPYGKTLLSLIPVRTGPGSPLLSATTMTADKRQLKDRITRIAQGQQTRAAALFLVLALAAGVCAVTFTGAKADGETGGVRSLTGDELAYFNEEFFNQEGTYSIRNQFLNSLYEKPEDIDLFELFYCGTGIDAPMTDEELRDHVEHISVYARVSPEHKIRIVRAWQDKGNIVAMTGDGVNDAPALKQADIGVAMGITGTEVSKDAASMILTDDNFATIVKAVENGRNLYQNIKYAIQFLLSGNFGAILVVLYASIFALPVPFAPVHLLFINLLTDSLPAIALGLEPHSTEVMKEKPRPANESILTKVFLMRIGAGGVSICVMTTLAFLIGYHGWFTAADLGGSALLGSTMAFGTLCVSRLFHGFNCKSDRPVVFTRKVWNNKWLIGAFVLGMILITFALTCPGVDHIFKVQTLGLPQLLTVYGLAFLNIPVIQRVKAIREKLCR